MLQRNFLEPKNMWKRIENGNLLYSPILVIHGADHAHVYLAGQTSRLPSGEEMGKGNMRAQIRQTCENIKIGLENVGASFEDVVRMTLYVTDIEEYYRCCDERYKYFATTRPPSTIIQIQRLGPPNAMIEIEVEAIVEPKRLRI
jgi:2-iminobutanoate/2-iminopropanoate deaminase